MRSIPYRLGLQQRVFPAYRAQFFDTLARACTGGLSVFSGAPMQDEALGKPGELHFARHVEAKNDYLGWGPLLMVWQQGMLDWLRTWNPDVLLADTNPRNISTNLALHWMHERHRPVIGWGLGAPAFQGHLAGLLVGSRRRFLGGFDALIAYSHAGAEQFHAAGVPSQRIFVAPNAATSAPARPLPNRPEGFAFRPVVLFVGRLQARKRVDALLRACARLPEELQPRVVIVGDGPAREEFEMAASRYYPSAEFVGARHDDALEPYYTDADLFVLPGTGGLAVQQAMRYGLPVIVAEADGTQSDLVRPQNGWMLPANDENALYEALAEALSNPARLRQMGAESYRIVQDEVNLERMVEVFSDVIQHVMS